MTTEVVSPGEREATLTRRPEPASAASRDLLLAAATPPSQRFMLVNGVEAWVRVRGATAAARRQARRRFLVPLLEHLQEYGLGHLPELADGDPPHALRGCPFQAWSVGEALRLERDVLAQRGTTAGRRKR